MGGDRAPPDGVRRETRRTLACLADEVGGFTFGYFSVMGETLDRNAWAGDCVDVPADRDFARSSTLRR